MFYDSARLSGQTPTATADRRHAVTAHAVTRHRFRYSRLTHSVSQTRVSDSRTARTVQHVAARTQRRRPRCEETVDAAKSRLPFSFELSLHSWSCRARARRAPLQGAAVYRTTPSPTGDTRPTREHRGTRPRGLATRRSGDCGEVRCVRRCVGEGGRCELGTGLSGA